jgi:hypothetical protein
MNPYAPPEGRIEDTERGRRPKLDMAVWPALVACVLHTLFFAALLLAVAGIAYAETGTLSLLGTVKSTVFLLPASTALAAWAIYRRQRITIIPSICLPIAIAAHFSRIHAHFPMAYFAGSLVLVVYVLGLIATRRLG